MAEQGQTDRAEERARCLLREKVGHSLIPFATENGSLVVTPDLRDGQLVIEVRLRLPARDAEEGSAEAGLTFSVRVAERLAHDIADLAARARKVLADAG